MKISVVKTQVSSLWVRDGIFAEETVINRSICPSLNRTPYMVTISQGGPGLRQWKTHFSAILEAINVIAIDHVSKNEKIDHSKKNGTKKFKTKI